jgi:hypothetical protein
MYKKFVALLIVLSVLFGGTAYAGKFVTLPDGNQIDVSKLSQQELYDLVKISSKASDATKKSVTDLVMGIDPEELDKWRVLFTRTVKDICTDFSISVNEFIKTPVGMGVSALIIYNIAGEDILDGISDLVDVILCVPFWLLFTAINGFLAFYFYGAKTVYDIVKEDGKTIKTNGRKIPRYPWKQRNNDEVLPKDVFGWYLVLSEILVTFVCFLIIIF